MGCCALLFTWDLGIQIQVFVFAQQALHPLSHSSSPGRKLLKMTANSQCLNDSLKVSVLWRRFLIGMMKSLTPRSSALGPGIGKSVKMRTLFTNRGGSLGISSLGILLFVNHAEPSLAPALSPARRAWQGYSLAWRMALCVVTISRHGNGAEAAWQGWPPQSGCM